MQCDDKTQAEIEEYEVVMYRDPLNHDRHIERSLFKALMECFNNNSLLRVLFTQNAGMIFDQRLKANG